MNSPAVTISELTDVTPEVVAAFARLIPQLSSSSPSPGTDELVAMANSDSTHILLARDPSGAIVGSMSLVIFRIPTGVRAWIEDVVVDDAGRGMGVGGALIEAATRRALDAGAKSIDLTSRPSREAANRLYMRLGFNPRDTNVYRYGGG